VSHVKRAPREHKSRNLSIRQYAAIRLCELTAIARCRALLGVQTNQTNWTFAVRHTLAPLKELEGGLDIEHIRKMDPYAMPAAGDDDIVATIHRVCRFRKTHPKVRGLTAKVAGRLIDLTDEERWLCAEIFGRPITTMWAIDRTPERDKFVRDNRERERKRRERKRQGRLPRQEWLAANTASRDRPWLAMSVSRATYYRIKAIGGLPSADCLPAVSSNAKALRGMRSMIGPRGNRGGETGVSTDRLKKRYVADTPVSRHHNQSQKPPKANER
jgi:hypothetical protein